MKPSIAFFAVLYLFHSSVSAQWTYWVDASCTNTDARRDAINKAVPEAIDLAHRGYQRLQSATDTDQKWNFFKLFKADYNNDQNARDHVNQVLGLPPPPGNGIATWQSTQNRQQSRVRIYCDNDAQNPNGGSRWTLAPDPPQQFQYAGYIPQAQRPRYIEGLMPAPGPNGPFYQEWYDVANGIMTTSRGCQTPQWAAQAVNYKGIIPGTQNNLISVITVCDIQLNGVLHSFDDIPLKKDINSMLKNPPAGLPTAIDGFAAMTAVTIMHEFCHTSWFNRIDVKLANNRAAYYWNDVINLNTADSLNNVSNYVFQALLAKLADRGWRLSKVGDQWRTLGLLVYDKDNITQKLKRWVSWIA